MSGGASVVVVALYVAALGHLMRSIAAAKELQRRGHHVTLACGAEGASIVRRHGIRWSGLREVPPLPASIFSRRGVRAKLPDRGWDRAYVEACIEDESRLIRKERADMVLFDYRNTAGVTAAVEGIRSMAIHNVNLLGTVGRIQGLQQQTMRDAGLPETAVAKVFGDAIAIVGFPFFEPLSRVPSEALVRALNVVDELRYVGPLLVAHPAQMPSRTQLRQRYGRAARKLVLVTFGGAAVLLASLEAALAGLRGIGCDLIVVRGPNISSRAVGELLRRIQSSSVESQVRVVGFTPRVVEFMKAADAAVTHGGHGTLMEAILCGTPSIVVVPPGRAEQAENGRMMERLGIGRLIGGGSEAEQTYADIEKRIRPTLEELLTDGDVVARARRLSLTLRRHDGPRELARFVESRLLMPQAALAQR